jgi:DNA adenine methylase
MQPYVDIAGAYVEPFVGGANVITRIASPLKYAADANVSLITLWKRVQEGWEPPSDVSQSEYALAKQVQDPTDPMTAFLGFGCSFAGKWFGGFARSDDRNYATNARNSIANKAAGLSGVRMWAADYRRIPYVEGAVVYCDPPYQGTTPYGAVGDFDTSEFWDFVRALAHEGYLPLVSEYAAPADFAVAWEIETKLDIRNGAGVKEGRVERLFIHQSQKECL